MVVGVTVMSVDVTPLPDRPEHPPLAAVVSPKRARRLAVLGDSTAVGLGDPLPRRGGWRGVGPLVAAALGVDRGGYLNPSFAGARMRCVLTKQVPAAVAHRPDVALLIAGMNDTLRPDFDASRVAADLAEVIRRLRATGTVVLPVRFHDHSRVFRLPASLKRALSARVAELNAAIDDVVAREGVSCLDLARLPGAYDLASWSVDRLHPSELGHRMLADGFTGLLAEAGFDVPEPVSLACGGGAQPSAAGHVGWLVLKGIPWLWRRGREFLPYAAVIMWNSFRAR
ncbi:SGNH/GDSL hydrolase family protein [Amycolatopsis rifamycinica]|uniref:SGNH hydrolase n=1 Tax=Amycolatopsis rifamycinica TaxID=287986 RepID=A0A066U103_9PSEU|nr:SGNH/GDSL hydrolase family protein [Amycolatopsis rifamycinica]KDN21121.1 SGNH hydrolase [Amycolatopsis rifamycinica]